MYKIEFSDKSYMIVDADFNIVLFEKNSLKAIFQITINDYFNNPEKYSDFVVCDKINEKLIPLSINVTKIDSYSKPLNQRVKKVEDIVVGDFVLGPDMKPREVLELHRGEDEIYEIETEDGNKHRVNATHMLSLFDTETKEYINMPLNVYLMMNDDFKSKVKMWKV